MSRGVERWPQDIVDLQLQQQRKISKRMALQDREDLAVRITVMRAALRDIGFVPEYVFQNYIPTEKKLIIPLVREHSLSPMFDRAIERKKISLQQRGDGTVRMAVMKTLFENAEEIPDTALQTYHPDTRRLEIKL